MANLTEWPYRGGRPLVISAVDDLFGTSDGARYTAEQVPRARFIGYPSGGHLLVGRQKEVTSEVAAFLK